MPNRRIWPRTKGRYNSVNPHLKKKDELPTEENALATKANACYTMFSDGMGVCYYSEMMGVNTTHPVEYMKSVFHTVTSVGGSLMPSLYWAEIRMTISKQEFMEYS